MRITGAILALIAGAQFAAAETLDEVIADRCLGVLMQGADWNTEGFRAPDPSEIGDYPGGPADILWVSPDGHTLLAVDPSQAGAELRFCAVAQLPYPAAQPEDLPAFDGEGFRALLEDLGLEPVEECWGLDSFGSTSWWAHGLVAGGTDDFAAYLTRDSSSLTLFAYQPVGDVRRDCMPLKPGGG